MGFHNFSLCRPVFIKISKVRYHAWKVALTSGENFFQTLTYVTRVHEWIWSWRRYSGQQIAASFEGGIFLIISSAQAKPHNSMVVDLDVVFRTYSTNWRCFFFVVFNYATLILCYIFILILSKKKKAAAIKSYVGNI